MSTQGCMHAQMMVNLLRISVDWLKMAWARQPVLVISCVMGVMGKSSGCSRLAAGTLRCALFRNLPLLSGPLFVVLGPGTEKGQLERREWPTHYDRSKL